MKTNAAWGNDGSSFEKERKQELEKILNVGKEDLDPIPEQKQTETPQQTAPPETATQDQDAGNEEESTKYDNILRQNYGFSDDEINDKARKIAKSWTHVQAMAVKNKQEAQQYKSVVENLNSVLSKYPSLYEKLEQAAKGQYTENPEPKETVTTVQPKNMGELGDDVSERDLIEGGYITAAELEGLGEYARQRKLLRAEAKYIREREVNNYLNDIQTKQDTLAKQQEAERLRAENERRLSDGFDNFIAKTGVNFAELDQNVVDLINKRVAYTRDPNNPQLIAEDAFDLVGPSVLAQAGIQLTQPQTTTRVDNKTTIQDTGTSFSKNSPPSKRKLTLSEQLSERANNRYISTQPRSKFKLT